MARRAFVNIGLGVVGVVLAYVVFHLWTDHQVFHVLVQLEAQRQARIQQSSPLNPPKPEGK